MSCALAHHTIVLAYHGELSPTDATVSFQMPMSITEGNSVAIAVDLSSLPDDGLQVDLVVTLSVGAGTASEWSF